MDMEESFYFSLKNERNLQDVLNSTLSGKGALAQWLKVPTTSRPLF